MILNNPEIPGEMNIYLLECQGAGLWEEREEICLMSSWCRCL